MKNLENKKFSENLNISENTKKEIENSNKLENEGLNVEDNSTTKSNKSNCDDSNIKEESKTKKLKKLLDNKTGLFFEGSEKYKNFMTSFGALKNVDSNAFEGALKAVRKSWEEENKEEIEKFEKIDAVDFFENILKDKEIKALIDNVFCNNFDYKKIVKDGYIICYLSDSCKNDNENKDNERKDNYTTITINDIYSHPHTGTVYYKKLDSNRTNYIKAVIGFSYYIKEVNKVKKAANKAGNLLIDLRTILQKIKDKGANKSLIDNIINDVFK